MHSITLAVDAARQLAITILRNHGVSTANAECVAAALVDAEIDGQKGHGLSRLPSYAAQAATGKVKGEATPKIDERTGATIRVDAQYGFAYPAIALAIDALATLAKDNGVGAATIYRSHHFGQAGRHVEQLAERQLIGMIFGNSPKAIAPWGGKDAVYGTNPMAFAAPRVGNPPLVIDLSLSKVARGKVMVAAENNEPIPEGWALDGEGNATTDANAALAGTMLPMGDAKGAALVMMVEILAAALTGANFGFEASSFFTAEGEPPGTGQMLLAIDPERLSGGQFNARLEVLIVAVTTQQGVRLPGTSRLTRREAASERFDIPQKLHDQLVALANA